MFEAGCMFLPSFRRIGARSVYIHHTVFDRALQSPLKRMFQQRSELIYDKQAQCDEPKESDLDYLLEWFVSTAVRVDLGPTPN